MGFFKKLVRKVKKTVKKVVKRVKKAVKRAVKTVKRVAKRVGKAIAKTAVKFGKSVSRAFARSTRKRYTGPPRAGDYTYVNGTRYKWVERWIDVPETGNYNNARYKIERIPVSSQRWWANWPHWFNRFSIYRRLSQTSSSIVGFKKITGLSSAETTAFLAKMTSRKKVPATLVSYSGNTVMTVNIELTTFGTRVSYRAKFLWFRVTRWKTVQTPVFRVYPNEEHFFATNLNNTSSRSFRFWWFRYKPARSATPKHMSHKTAAELFNKYSLSMKGLFFSIPNRSLTDNSRAITDQWSSVGISSSRGRAIGRALTSVQWVKGRSAYTLPLSSVMNKTLTHVKDLREGLLDYREVLKGVNYGTFVNMISSLEDKTLKLASVKRYKQRLTDANLTKTKNKIEEAIVLADALISMIESKSTTDDYLTFSQLNLYKEKVAALEIMTRSPVLLNVIRSYIGVMHEIRKVTFKLRANTADGTLLGCARLEMPIAIQNEAAGLNPDPPRATLLGPDAVLKVAERNTNMNRSQKANGADATKEIVTVVYVEVEYDENDEPIRPKSGIYTLSSTESAQAGSAFIDPRWMIEFQGEKCPDIVKGVVVGLDEIMLSKVLNADITPADKICLSRKEEDWWKIIVKEGINAPAAIYATNMTLTLMPDDDTIVTSMNAIGEVKIHPVLEVQDKTQVGIAAASNAAIEKANDFSLKP